MIAAGAQTPTPATPADDFERQARQLSGHTIRAAFDSAKELQAGGEAAASALSKMARLHRRAADLIDEAALHAKLQIKAART
jgi:hypothetical protein